MKNPVTRFSRVWRACILATLLLLPACKIDKPPDSPIATPTSSALTPAPAPTQTAAPTPQKLAEDYAGLVEALRATGATVTEAGQVTQPFFSTPGRVIGVNNGNVQVFEYKDAAAARGDADKVKPDGYQVGDAMVDWVAPPHFFHQGRVIALYVGSDKAVLAGLTATLGKQFAGARS